jgi:hypothetical protein
MDNIKTTVAGLGRATEAGFTKFRKGILVFLSAAMLFMGSAFIFTACSDDDETSSVSFWSANSELGRLSIKVVGDGGFERSGTLTHYFTSGSPDKCGENMTLTFSGIPDGSYSYTITDSDGDVIDRDSFSLKKGECQLIEFK